MEVVIDEAISWINQMRRKTICIIGNLTRTANKLQADAVHSIRKSVLQVSLGKAKHDDKNALCY